MGKFEIRKTGLQGLVTIEPTVYGDNRGFFMETWNRRDFEQIGLSCDFVQDNLSSSKKGVLRGLHFQKNHPQGKLVHVLVGEVFDVAVDIRKESPSFGKWFGTVLSSEKKNVIYVPEGFAHGFLVLSETAMFSYKCTRYYDMVDEGGIIWSDKDIGVEWPVEDVSEIILSEKDKLYPMLKDLKIKQA